MFTLQKLRILKISTVLEKSLSISCTYLKYEKRETKFLQKIMGKSSKRKVFISDELPRSVTASKLSSAHGQGKESNRRINVLNKLFMTNITNLMTTETFGQEILGYGVQVSRVKVTPDFHSVNVFWLAKGDEHDSSVEKILKSMSGALRHELSQLRLMGEVPRINFVKDKLYSKAAEVDSMLKKADFGEDFVPTDPTLFMTSIPELEMSLSPEIKAKIVELENSTDDYHEQELPEMRNDVLGIDHTEIMKKITKSMDKTKVAWEKYESKSYGNDLDPSVRNSSMEDSISKLNKDVEVRENFIKFLEKRQYAKKSTPERKKDQKLVDFQSNLEEPDVDLKNKFDDGDFIVEDDVDYKK